MFRLSGEEMKRVSQAVIPGAGMNSSQIVISSPAGFGRARNPLKSQTVISKTGRGGQRYRFYAFTEEGVAMLSSVLRSERAIDVNIAIMRAFVKLRETLETNRELARKFAELEARVGKHGEKIDAIIEAIRQLMSPPPKPASRDRLSRS